MPRNQSGTYTLPSGNPVSAGTLIDATWANNTLNDLANEMTDSLSRSGEGGMLAPFRLADGSQSTPGVAWTNEPSSGFYRAGSNDMWAVVGGTQITQFTSTGMLGRFAAGAVTTPSVSAFGDTNTGIYFPGADQVAIATGGVQRLSVDASGGVSVPGTFSVTGNVTIDTNTLFVDAASNRVGVGTVTPAVRLDVAGGISIANSDNLTWGGAYGATTPAISGAAGFLAFYPNGSTSGEQMRLNSTGLGIGTSSPPEKLSVNGNIGLIKSGVTRIYNTQSTSDSVKLGGALNIEFETYSGAAWSTKMLLDNSGNLGLGVTPSAWNSTYKAMQVTGSFGLMGGAGAADLYANAFLDSGSAFRYVANGAAAAYSLASGQHRWFTAPSGTAGNTISFTQAMTLDALGNLGVGTTGPLQKLDARGAVTIGSSGTAIGVISRSVVPSGSQGMFLTANYNQVENNGTLTWADTSSYGAGIYLGGNATDSFGGQVNIYAYSSGANGNIITFSRRTGAGTVGESARITSGGDFLVGTTNANPAGGNVTGHSLKAGGLAEHSNASNVVVVVNRKTDDGDLIRFLQDGTTEGSISVSGNTVSYNAFAGSHWSQLQDGGKPDILRGTVMESINELCEWPDETNERLPKAKISDTAGSKKVYGVFMAWDNDWTETNDMYVTAVGAFICRVNGSVTVQEGDLLESNGDGTARVQADDIIRSSTIGKVTSTVKTHEYDDGSYCVPTVLYCG